MLDVRYWGMTAVSNTRSGVIRAIDKHCYCTNGHKWPVLLLDLL